jgi:hypothetical protein
MTVRIIISHIVWGDLEKLSMENNQSQTLERSNNDDSECR